MEEIRFGWDARKAAGNLRKHKVSFDEAATVFYDEKAIEYFDPDHSEDEDRFLLLGLSWRLRVVVVCYCIRSHGYQIRIISARKATRNETKVYTGAAK